MENEEIISLIEQHQNFGSLNFVQKERIVAPTYLRWIKTCMKCMIYNQERVINLVSNIKWLDPEFRIIYLDVLKNINRHAQ